MGLEPGLMRLIFFPPRRDEPLDPIDSALETGRFKLVSTPFEMVEFLRKIVFALMVTFD